MLWKKTIIWIAAFAVMTLAAILVHVIPSNGPAEKMELPTVTRDNVVKMELSKGGNALTLEKSDDAWIMNPGQLRASPRKVERLLDSVAAFSVGGVITKKAGMHDQYDVGSAGTTLSITTKEGPGWSLVIGKDTEDKSGSYVRQPDSDKVYISFRSLGSMLNLEPSYWHDRRMIYFEKDAPTALKINAPKGVFSFVKNPDSGWGFETTPDNLPSDFILDPQRVQRVVDSLSNMTAVNFGAPDTDAEKAGMNSPNLTATITLPGKDPVVVKIGDKEAKNYYAQVQGDPTFYLVTEYNYKNLNKDLEEFRNLFVTSFDEAKAKKVEIRDFTKSKSVTLVKDGAWKIESANPEPDPSFVMDPVKVANVVKGASQYEARAYVGKTPPEKAGLSKPNATLIVTMDDGNTHTIRFGKDADENDLYVQGDKGFVFSARKVTRDMLVKGLDDLKVSAKQQVEPTFSADALQNLPPDLREQILQKQRNKIMQSQMLKQIMKQQKQKNK